MRRQGSFNPYTALLPSISLTHLESALPGRPVNADFNRLTPHSLPLESTRTKNTGGGGPTSPYNPYVPSLSTHRELLASSADSGERLDRFIATNCPELSRTRVQELIESGLVLVDGVPAKKGAQHLRGTEKISLEAPERPAIIAEPESIPLDVLYEDDDVIAINKPAGMVVHAGAGNPTGTLVNALLGRGQSLSQGGDALRPGIVHRLDKETSGVILVAKNDAAHAKLGEAFRQRAVKKTYIALVQGLVAENPERLICSSDATPFAALAWPCSKSPGMALPSRIFATREPTGAFSPPLRIPRFSKSNSTPAARIRFVCTSPR